MSGYVLLGWHIVLSVSKAALSVRRHKKSLSFPNENVNDVG